MSDSELLRHAVALLLLTPNNEGAPVTPMAAEDLVLERIMVRLPAFLARASAERARFKGMALSRWMAALAQSNVAASPVLTDREVDAVETLARELGAIGRNINQIARALNEAHFQTERVRLDRLQEVSDLVAEGRQAVRELVRASRNSWEAEA